MNKIEWKSINFSDESFNKYFQKNGDQKEEDKKPYGLLIKNCPSILGAFEKITSDEIKLSSLTAIVFKIDKELLSFNEEQDDKIFQKLSNLNSTIFLSFTSTITKCSKLFWKISDTKKVFELFDYIDVFEVGKFMENPANGYIHNFILSSILIGHSGIIPSIKFEENREFLTPIRVEFLGRTDNYNLLMNAVEEKQGQNIIKHLIDLDIQINYPVNGKLAISLTDNEEIQLLLLKNESFYPEDFKMSVQNKNLSEFIHDVEKIHLIVKEMKRKKDPRTKDKFEMDQIEKLKEILYNPQGNTNVTVIHKSRFYYNSKNVSLATVALNAQNDTIYNFLIENSITISPYEDCKALQDRTNQIKLNLRDSHSLFTKSWYLDVLQGNSNVGHDLNVKEHKNRRKFINEAFEILDKNELISPYLQLVAASKKFEIVFEFNRSSIEHLNPKYSRAGNITKGVYDPVGIHRMYVAAEEFLDPNPNKKDEAIGTLAHELYHYAMQLVFQNYSNPFSLGDEEAEKDFKKILVNIESNKMGIENIVDLTFKYPSLEQPRELIVRIPHMMAHYHRKENQDKLNNLLFKEYGDLFNFYKNLLSKIEAAIPVITKIANRPKDISFNDLTEELKTTVRHSTVKFQGEEINFFEFVQKISLKSQDIDEIFNLLNYEQILKIFDGEIVDICEMPEDNTTFYIERTFEIENHEKAILPFAKNEKVLLEYLMKKDVPVISDSPGAGKTTTIQKIARNIKQKEKYKFVLYIDLQSKTDVLKKYDKCKYITDVIQQSEYVKLALLDILEFKSSPDIEIFKRCFDSRNLVTFFDGFDEVCPNFNDAVMWMLRTMKNDHRSQLWIGTRPQYAELIEKAFKTTSVILSPFSARNRADFLQLFYKNCNLEMIDEKFREYRTKMCSELTNQNDADESIKKFDEKFKTRENKINFLIDKIEEYVESIQSKEKSREINNPQMLKMIADISLDMEFPFNFENNYDIYQRFIDKKFKFIWSKGPVVQSSRDFVSQKMIPMPVFHQMCALHTIFGSYFEDIFTFEKIPIEELKIMQTEVDYSIDQLTTYGILVKKQNFLSKEKEFYKKFVFLHRSFAEFFVAQFLNVFIYSCMDKPDSDDEIARRLLLLFFIAKTPLEMIKDFICKFIEIGSKNPKTFNPRIKNLMLGRFYKVYAHLLYNQFSFKTSTKVVYNFFMKDPEISRGLWWIDDNETFLVWYAKNYPHDWMTHSNEIENLLLNTFEKKDCSKLLYGNNQRGSFLFQAWWIENYGCENFKENYELDGNKIRKYVTNMINLAKMDINDKNMTILSQKSNFSEFYKFCEGYLKLEEKREIFLRNSFKIFAQNNWYDAEEFENIWKLMVGVLNAEEIKLVLDAKSSFNESILFEVIKRRKNIKIALSLLYKYEYNFTKEKFAEILMKECGEEEYTTFETTIYQNDRKFCTEVWQTYLRNLNDEQKAKILIKSRFLWVTMAKREIDLFKSLLDLHKTLVSFDENQKFILDNRFEVLDDAIKSLDDKHFIEIIKFIKHYCNEDLVNMLIYRGYSFRETIFSKFKNIKKFEKKLKFLLGVLQDRMDLEIWKLFWCISIYNPRIDKFFDHIIDNTSYEIDDSKKIQVQGTASIILQKLNISSVSDENEVLLQMIWEFLIFYKMSDIQKYENLFDLFNEIILKELKSFWHESDWNIPEIIKVLQKNALENVIPSFETDNSFVELTNAVLESNCADQQDEILAKNCIFFNKYYTAFLISKFLSEIFTKNDDKKLRFNIILHIAQQESEIFMLIRKFLVEFAENNSKFCSKIDEIQNISFGTREASPIIFLTKIFQNHSGIVNQIWSSNTFNDINKNNKRILRKFAEKFFTAEKFKEITTKLPELEKITIPYGESLIGNFIQSIKKLHEKEHFEQMKYFKDFFKNCLMDDEFSETNEILDDKSYEIGESSGRSRETASNEVETIEDEEEIDQEILKVLSKRFGALGETLFMILSRKSSIQTFNSFWKIIGEASNSKNKLLAKKVLNIQNHFGGFALNYSIFNEDTEIFAKLLKIHEEIYESKEIIKIFFHPKNMLIYDVIQFGNAANCQVFIDFCGKIFKENLQELEAILTQTDDYTENVLSWFQKLHLESIHADEIGGRSSSKRLEEDSTESNHFQELYDALKYENFENLENETEITTDEITTTVTYVKHPSNENFKMIKCFFKNFSFEDDKIVKEFKEEYISTSDSLRDDLLWRIEKCFAEDEKELKRITLAVIKFKIFNDDNENMWNFIAKVASMEETVESSEDYNAIDVTTKFVMIKDNFDKFIVSEEFMFLLNEHEKYTTSIENTPKVTITSLFNEFEAWNTKKFQLDNHTGGIEQNILELRKNCQLLGLKVIFGYDLEDLQYRSKLFPCFV